MDLSYSSVQKSQCYGEDQCAFSMNRIVSELSRSLDQTTNLLFSAIVYIKQVCVEIVDSMHLS